MVLKLFDFVDRPTLVEERAVATAAPTAARGSITGRSSPTFPRRLRAMELPSTAGESCAAAQTVFISRARVQASSTELSGTAAVTPSNFTSR